VALEVAELVGKTKWPMHGLPENLNIRIALHSGPAFRVMEALLGSCVKRRIVTVRPMFSQPMLSTISMSICSRVIKDDAVCRTETTAPPLQDIAH
jgi:hypothetical protein